MAYATSTPKSQSTSNPQTCTGLKASYENKVALPEVGTCTSKLPAIHDFYEKTMKGFFAKEGRVPLPVIAAYEFDLLKEQVWPRLKNDFSNLQTYESMGLGMSVGILVSKLHPVAGSALGLGWAIQYGVDLCIEEGVGLYSIYQGEQQQNPALIRKGVETRVEGNLNALSEEAQFVAGAAVGVGAVKGAGVLRGMKLSGFKPIMEGVIDSTAVEPPLLLKGKVAAKVESVPQTEVLDLEYRGIDSVTGQEVYAVAGRSLASVETPALVESALVLTSRPAPLVLVEDLSGYGLSRFVSGVMPDSTTPAPWVLTWWPALPKSPTPIQTQLNVGGKILSMTNSFSLGGNEGGVTQSPVLLAASGNGSGDGKIPVAASVEAIFALGYLARAGNEAALQFVRVLDITKGLADFTDSSGNSDFDYIEVLELLRKLGHPQAPAVMMNLDIGKHLRTNGTIDEFGHEGTEAMGILARAGNQGALDALEADVHLADSKHAANAISNLVREGHPLALKTAIRLLGKSEAVYDVLQELADAGNEEVKAILDEFWRNYPR